MAQTAQQFKLWQRLRKRLWGFTFFVSVSFTILVLRVGYLQALKGEEYYEKSKRVIRKVVPLPAPRGEIFDRNYVAREKATYLVSNKSTLDLIAIPSHFRSGELRSEVAKLERLLKLKRGSLLEKITESKIRQNEEIVLVENLSPAQHTVLADYYLSFSRFIIRQSTRRHYNLGPVLAHVTGYVGLPSKKEIEAGIKSYQLVGKNGLEAYYDAILRGEDGEIVQIKTASGDVEEQKVFRNFIPGNNLVLTIDAELQQTAWQAMGERTGALIALEPATGEILALVSKPDYNPNLLVDPDREVRAAHFQEMLQKKAELNRAISAKYPPASSFKPLVALAALEERRSNSEQSFFCPGKFTLKSSYRGLPDTVFYDWAVHGYMDLVNALSQSCSVYFYELGYRIGAEPIIKYARYFYLDRLSQIDLPFEVSGFVPSPLWKEKQFQTRWFDGDTVNLSVGQGFLETTLIGMVNFYAALVNDGVVYWPHLVKEIRFAENDEIKEVIKPRVLYELPISRSTLEVIKKALRRVVTEGTARSVFQGSGLYPIAGKTGTVQTRSRERFANTTQHAWFIGYGPVDGPPENMIVVGVFVERGITGAAGAAPVAREIFLRHARKIGYRKVS
ncbi:MAG: penicillin-binding protein 2 [Leptospiraceae bacterium]|nr:penicillin-binding protein 2 [Leptospiraceae bacterium]MDW8306811.1 penicillin-binding protein 2 [Leptospiraceae bacterium]